jgi:glycosyltransferase involved in cell wall biosynthesis
MAHIGIDARLNSYRMGGISRYTAELVRALHALRPPHTLTVLTGRDGLPENPGFSTTRMSTPPHHRLERISLSVELARLRLDLLHSPDFIPPQRGARRHVITVHDLTFLHFPSHKDRASRAYYNDQIAWAVRRADHILTVSAASRDDLVTRLRVPEAKITVQPHGVGANFKPLADAEREEWRQKLDLPDSYILFVGTLEPRKNIPLLLDAYARLPMNLRDKYTLLLAGQPGWLFDDTLARITGKQARGARIVIRSDITDDALPALYSLARVLVLPSLYEGFGLPALEAMACGTVPLVSKTSSLPEVVGDVGRQFDPADLDDLTDALRVSLTDDKWLEWMRQQGLARTAIYTWERSAQIALSVYDSLV